MKIIYGVALLVILFGGLVYLNLKAQNEEAIRVNQIVTNINKQINSQDCIASQHKKVLALVSANIMK